MTDTKATEPFLEPLGPDGGAGSADGAKTQETPQVAYLEPTSEEAPQPASGRKKARAGDRGSAVPPVQEQASLGLLAALQTDRPILAALWSDVTPGELLRAPPPLVAFQTRCDWARRTIDLLGRRDAESRARAELAQRRLASELARLQTVHPEVLPAALTELREAQTREFVSDLLMLAGPGRTLFTSDRARWEELARQHGLGVDEAFAIGTQRGVTFSSDETRAWTPFAGLPGSPSSLDAVAVALLDHPAQGAELVRSGQVLEWLRGNGASTELIAKARDARLNAERGGTGALSVHTQAWALGRRELRLGRASLSVPSEVVGAVHQGKISLDDLGRSAREGLLGAWLRLQGWVAAAGAADLVARGEPTAMKRLGWSLGEPLTVGHVSFSDADTLVRAVLSQYPLREPLLALYASGDLLAWLESLAPALRDEQWIDRLRRNRDVSDTLPLWSGVYARARCTTLPLPRADGGSVTLAAVSQLCITADVATFWDGLKAVYRTGELHAWLGVVAPELAAALPTTRERDVEEGLNGLLWSLGHTGLVLEWGARDLAVRTTSDLVRAYRLDWQRLEGLLARNHVFHWLRRFHGTTWLVAPTQEVRDGAGMAMVEALDLLRLDVGRLPAGHAALKLALLCGLQALPSDPCIPGDEASFRGWTSATLRPNGDPTAWAPLRSHFQQGTALVWLGTLPGLRPGLGRSVLKNAFGQLDAGVDPAEHLNRVMAAVARDFGDPLPSPVLAAELGISVRRGGGKTLAGQRPSTSPWPILLTLLFIVMSALGAYAWYEHEQGDEGMTLAPAPPGSEVWVRMTVRLQADRTQLGSPWDRDNSLPELGAIVQTRDEPQRVGPCASSRTCEATFDNVRLVPNVVFRVRVSEHDPLWTDHLGEVLMRWRGGRDEEIATSVGGVSVRVTIRKITNQPASLTTPEPAPAPMPTPPTTGLPPAPQLPPRTNTRRRTTRDAGTPTRTTVTPRASSTRVSNGPVVPGGRLEPIDPNTPAQPMMPPQGFPADDE